jgi:dihydrofolate reductase
MRKVIVSNYVTLDGFFAGPNGEIDWFLWDEETARYAIDLLEMVDTILFGRVTYQMMAVYWPTQAAADENPVISVGMNTLPKVVFSKTLATVEWQNSRLVNGDMAAEIARLKQQPGKDLVIFGSGRIVSTLTPLGLIDEYRLIVNPVVLGQGKPLFDGIKGRLNLHLIKATTFACGNVLLQYQLVRGEPKWQVTT